MDCTYTSYELEGISPEMVWYQFPVLTVTNVPLPKVNPDEPYSILT